MRLSVFSFFFSLDTRYRAARAPAHIFSFLACPAPLDPRPVASVPVALCVVTMTEITHVFTFRRINSGSFPEMVDLTMSAEAGRDTYWAAAVLRTEVGTD
jgi:hypothetical protein